ncbi:MAG: hypothetical protein ACXWMI_11580 [Syntrophales bacterium]
MPVRELPLSTQGRSGGGWGGDRDCRFQMAVGERLEMGKMSLRTID